MAVETLYSTELWLLLASVTAALLVAELEIGMLPIAVPNIAQHLRTSGSWIGQATLIASVAVMPL